MKSLKIFFEIISVYVIFYDSKEFVLWLIYRMRGFKIIWILVGGNLLCFKI